MISVLLYGRNDAHGYNLHRRAALSLNCLAEVLTDPDDEILFVDYNTPDELPTFVEALADTLTDRCLGLLRVLRVPAALHAERFAARTHLPALEPVSRNAAARRAKATNRWFLSTNTDMVFLPLGDRSLSELCRDLPDNYYGLPRFELPEWLWERLPRSNPRRALAELERLGSGLRLDETTVSHQWIRFDAPGDFQLILRDDFVAIDGFDEEMVLGWHVDSNLSRRILFRRETIESLEDGLAGYHCNHSRTPTVYHGAVPVSNDLDRFFASVDRADLPAQRDAWGLADVELEEVAVRERVGPRFAGALLAAIPKGARSSSDALRAPFGLTYDSGHVLPFVADSLAVSAAGATVAYIGANPVLEAMLEAVVAGLAPSLSLVSADLDDHAATDALIRMADVFVVDLGVDSSALDDARRIAHGFDPVRLRATFAALDRLVEIERERLQDGEHPRRLVLVNGGTFAFDPYVTAHLDCSATTIHSRVRRATVKPAPFGDGAATSMAVQGHRLVHWTMRASDGQARLVLRPGEAPRFAELRDYGGFGEGWTDPDDYGIWTDGTRAELAIALEGVDKDAYRLALSIRGVCVGPHDTLTVHALVGGTRVATRRFPLRHLRIWWIPLKAGVVDSGHVDLALVVEAPRSPLAVGWSPDDRRLGVLIRSVALERASPTQALTDRVHRASLYIRARVGFRRHVKRLRGRVQRVLSVGPWKVVRR